jgi:hypothetical protein
MMWHRNLIPLADAIASHCAITTEGGRRLLYTALCDPDLSRVEDFFEAAGYEFERYYPTRKFEQGAFGQFLGPGSGNGVGSGSGSVSGSGSGYYYPTGWGEGSEAGFAMDFGFYGEGFGFPGRSGKNGLLGKSGKASDRSSMSSWSRTRDKQRGPVPPAFGGYEDDYEEFDDDPFDGFGGISRHPDALRGGKKTRVKPANEDGNKSKDAKPDRRLPFVHSKKLGDLEPSILAHAASELEALDLDQHLEYLGESLVQIITPPPLANVMLNMNMALTVRSPDISNVSGMGTRWLRSC